MKQVRVYFH